MLRRFLNTVCDLERNRYMLQQMIVIEKDRIWNVEQTQKALREKKVREKPEIQPVPEMKGIAYFISEFIKWGMIYGISAVLLWFVIKFVVAIIAYAIKAEDEKVKLLMFYIGVALGTIAVALAVLLAWCFYSEDIDKAKKIKQSNESNENDYKKLCARIDAISRKLTMVRSDCEKNIGHMQERIQEVEDTLIKYYDLNILYEKYRNLEAVCKIVEYMESGRCNSLYGPSGAYDTYEREYRADLVLDKLDKVIDKLDEIRASNIVLSQTMQQVNRSMNQVYQGLGEQQNILNEIGVNIGRGIDSLNRNVKAIELMTDVVNTNVKGLQEIGEYQNYVIKQERMKQGYWE